MTKGDGNRIDLLKSKCPVPRSVRLAMKGGSWEADIALLRRLIRSPPFTSPPVRCGACGEWKFHFPLPLQFTPYVKIEYAKSLGHSWVYFRLYGGNLITKVVAQRGPKSGAVCYTVR